MLILRPRSVAMVSSFIPYGAGVHLFYSTESTSPCFAYVVAESSCVAAINIISLSALEAAVERNIAEGWMRPEQRKAFF